MNKLQQATENIEYFTRANDTVRAKFWQRRRQRLYKAIVLITLRG